MYRPQAKYTENQAQLVWDSVAFNDKREYAFFDGVKWYHPSVYFDSFQEFYAHLVQHQISDIHVKALDDGGGREWVVDVDFKETCPKRLALKIAVAADTFKHFYGDNVSRVMHSGNRGVHVWLRIDRFRMSAPKAFRQRYYKLFEPPKRVAIERIRPGCFVYSLKATMLKHAAAIRRLYNVEITADKAMNANDDCAAKLDKNNMKSGNNDDNDNKITESRGDNLDIITGDPLDGLLLELWPCVDQHVFCNLNQIRAPHSFNYKGDKFSYQL